MNYVKYLPSVPVGPWTFCASSDFQREASHQRQGRDWVAHFPSSSERRGVPYSYTVDDSIDMDSCSNSEESRVFGDGTICRVLLYLTRPFQAWMQLPTLSGSIASCFPCTREPIKGWKKTDSLSYHHIASQQHHPRPKFDTFSISISQQSLDE